MNFELDTFLDTTYPPCIMTGNTIACIYGYPEEGFPICLTLGSHYSLIPALFDLLDLVTQLEDANEFIFKLQVSESRVEVHFDHLGSFAALLLLSFLSSVPFSDIGNWAFVASSMDPDTAEKMKLLISDNDIELIDINASDEDDITGE